jgi:EAL domain-containing protein (putative c-di-GMP-specific phosphodiesterase class I)
MARSLDIEVIVADIESDPHLETAKAIGCDAGQGDWQCPSLNFEKLCSALFTGHRNEQSNVASRTIGPKERSASGTSG